MECIENVIYAVKDSSTGADDFKTCKSSKNSVSKIFTKKILNYGNRAMYVNIFIAKYPQKISRVLKISDFRGGVSDFRVVSSNMAILLNVLVFTIIDN